METEAVKEYRTDGGFAKALNRMDRDSFQRLVSKLINSMGLEIMNSRFEDEIYDIEAKPGSENAVTHYPGYLIRLDRSEDPIPPEDMQDFASLGRDDDRGLIYITTSDFSEGARLYAKEFEIEIVDDSTLTTILRKTNLLRDVLTYRDAEILRTEKGRYLPSIDELESIIESGNRAYLRRDYKAALDLFIKATQLKPNYDDAWYMLGVILNRMQKPNEALEAFMKALESNIENENAWYNMGLTLYSLGRLHEEIECYDKAIEYKRNFLPAWNNKGSTLLQLERFEEAIQCYEEILRMDPQFKMALNNKGLALKKLRRNEEAIQFFTRAIELDPNYIDPWFNKGVALLDSRQYKNAYFCLEAVLGADPDHIPALYNKGKVLERLGQYSESLKCYDRIIALDSRFYAAKRRKKKAQKSLDQKGDSELPENFFELTGDMAVEFRQVPVAQDKGRILVRRTEAVIPESTRIKEKTIPPTPVESPVLPKEAEPIAPPEAEEPQMIPQEESEVVPEKEPIQESPEIASEAKALLDMKLKLEKKETELKELESWLRDRYEVYEKDRLERGDLEAAAEALMEEKETLDREKDVIRKEKARLVGQSKGVAKAKQNLSSKESELVKREGDLKSRFDEVEMQSRKMTLREKELEKAAIRLRKRQDELELQAKILRDKERSLQENMRLMAERKPSEGRVKDLLRKISGTQERREPTEKEIPPVVQPEPMKVQDTKVEIEPKVEEKPVVEQVSEPVEVKEKEEPMAEVIETRPPEKVPPIAPVTIDEETVWSFEAGEVDFETEVLALYSMKHYDDALTKIEGYTKSGLESKLLWNIKGNILRDKKLLEEALTCYEQALKLDQRYIFTNLNMMSLCSDLGRFGEAFGYCNKILEARPKDEKVLFEKALLEIRAGQYDEALSTADDLLEINGTLEGVWNLKGVVLHNLNRDGEALSCYERALELHPDYASAWNNKGVLHYRSDEFDEALECFNKAETFSSANKIKLNKAAVQQKFGITEEAAEESKEPEGMAIMEKFVSQTEDAFPLKRESAVEEETEELEVAKEVDETDAVEESAEEGDPSLFMCPSCGAFVSAAASKCERCGYDFDSEGVGGEEEEEQEGEEEEIGREGEAGEIEREGEAGEMEREGEAGEMEREGEAGEMEREGETGEIEDGMEIDDQEDFMDIVGKDLKTDKLEKDIEKERAETVGGEEDKEGEHEDEEVKGVHEPEEEKEVTDEEVTPKEPEKDEVITELMNISGIGPSKAKALYEAGFRSYDDLREASVADIAEVRGMSTTLAKIIKKRLRSKKFRED